MHDFWAIVFLVWHIFCCAVYTITYKLNNMKNNPRAVVAYIVGCLSKNRNCSSIYDYSSRKYINISGTVELSQVSVFDYEQRCYITGSGNNGSFSLFHHGDQHYITLNFKNGNFDGYDYGSRCPFSGSVSGSSISLYDYGERKYYSYSI